MRGRFPSVLEVDRNPKSIQSNLKSCRSRQEIHIPKSSRLSKNSSPSVMHWLIPCAVDPTSDRRSTYIWMRFPTIIKGHAVHCRNVALRIWPVARPPGFLEDAGSELSSDEQLCGSSLEENGEKLPLTSSSPLLSSGSRQTIKCLPTKASARFLVEILLTLL